MALTLYKDLGRGVGSSHQVLYFKIHCKSCRGWNGAGIFPKMQNSSAVSGHLNICLLLFHSNVKAW